MAYNTRIKLYNGVSNIACFSRHIFNNPNSLKPVNRKYSKDKNILRNDSIKRSRDKIYDIALLNDFRYFVTFTFNDSIVNAFDYDLAVKKLKKWLNNMVIRKNLQYLLVPELHKSGRIHFHALMNGDLKLQDSTHKTHKGQVIYNCLDWKYGFSTAIETDGNNIAVSKYVVKYITKDLTKVTKHLYYAGGYGLKRIPDTYYYNCDFHNFNAPLNIIKDVDLLVKYKTI